MKVRKKSESVHAIQLTRASHKESVEEWLNNLHCLLPGKYGYCFNIPRCIDGVGNATVSKDGVPIIRAKEGSYLVATLTELMALTEEQFNREYEEYLDE